MYNLVKKFPFNIDDYYKDINLLDLNNNIIKLSKIIKRDVLNVIISGSITWPPFRVNISLFNELFTRYQDKYNFICAYLKEAHANNEWPVRNNKELMINQHENSQERVDLALKLKNKYGFKMSLYVDTMDNEFVHEYAGWPLQALLIYNDKIKWNIKPKRPGYLDFDDLESILEQFCKH